MLVLKRLLATLIGALVFIIIIPYGMALTALQLDRALELPYFGGLWPFMLATLFVAIGLGYVVWSSYVQIRVAEASPLPVIPSKRLIVTGPYAHCRNPMFFGVTLYYLGLGLLLGSLSYFLLVFIVALFSAVYIKLIEEKELEKRFGKKYIEYKRRTSFFFPRFRR